jgi:glycerol-3-phosphate dehydrogenase (NAD(P)+)
MSNIIILGAGSMGVAFSVPCSDRNHNVTIVGTHLEDRFIDLINSKKIHPILKYKIPKNVNFVKFNMLSKVINKNTKLIAVAVVSKGIAWAATELSRVLMFNTPILILTKGLSLYKNNYEVLAHKMDRLLKKNGIKKTNITAAGGPCLAKGLSIRVNTSIVFANKQLKMAKKIADMVETNYYHIETSKDVIGVEICAAIKNIFSMTIGASEGLCSKDIPKIMRSKNYLNTAAALINQSIREMILFTTKFGGKKDTVLGLAGIGDLYVSTDGGRNSKMGYYIGQGFSYNYIKKFKMPGVTIEGADLIKEIGKKVVYDFNVKKLPLMNSMISTILDGKTLKIDWSKF